MRDVFDYPPNIHQIRRVFPLTGREIFAWGNIIYNPSASTLTPELLAHEEVHKVQQGNDVEGWWDRYLVDVQFRYRQELEAHRAEFKEFCKSRPNRVRKRVFLKQLARRLSSPMYGSVVTFEKARKLIK